jgi:hypothetical protein
MSAPGRSFASNAFVGVYDRRLDQVFLFDRGAHHGARRGHETS